MYGSTKDERIDVHTTITQQIIDALEIVSSEDYRCPWHRSSGSILAPRNVASGKPYNGINILSLWVSADTKSYGSGLWGTYRQWQAAGKQVCKGERSTTIVFYKELEAKEDAELPEDARRKRLMARASPVFAAEQCEGYEPEDIPPADPVEQNERAEAFLYATDAVIRHQGERAFYSRASDEITLPPRFAFRPTLTSTREEAYYSTAFHELGHWTGAKPRLDREFGKRFGDDAYAAEELTAELTAAFLCSALEVSNVPRLDHAQYVASWLKVLKADNHAVFTAASKASQAVAFLNGCVGQKMRQLRPSDRSP